jgi:hypothetical protein
LKHPAQVKVALQKVDYKGERVCELWQIPNIDASLVRVIHLISDFFGMPFTQ